MLYFTLDRGKMPDWMPVTVDQLTLPKVEEHDNKFYDWSNKAGELTARQRKPSDFAEEKRNYRTQGDGDAVPARSWDASQIQTISVHDCRWLQ